MFLFVIVMAFSANCMALPSNSGQHVAESKSDLLNTELVAPISSSLSQYYQPPPLVSLQIFKQQQEQLKQPQTLAQLLGLHQNQHQQQQQQPIFQPIQQTQINPFLYLGQLMSTDTGEQISNNQSQKTSQSLQQKRRSDERSLQNQEKNSYVLYRPSEDDQPEYVDLAPPAVSQKEPNYYLMLVKPRKFKKFVEENVEDKKLKARKDVGKLKHQIKNDETQNESDLLTESSDYIEQSEPTSRLDFQMHGHKGPKSYKFGFDYGSNAGLNRQFRVEERESNGDVYGRYGYYDRTGKFREVNYSSTANGGFKVHR